MNINLSVVAPVELFTPELFERACRALRPLAMRAANADVRAAYERLFGVGGEWLGFDHGECAVEVILRDTSAAFLVRLPPQAFFADWAFVRDYLEQRARFHDLLISGGAASPLGAAMFVLAGLEGPQKIPIRPSYVFSFSFITECAAEPSEAARPMIAALAEPSSLRIDDFSREGVNARDPPQLDALPAVEDVDLASDHETYITWSTIVCLCKGGAGTAAETRGLLSAMEMRLQQTWNGCYEFSRLVDVILSAKGADAELEDFFLAVARSIDEARAVVSSTASARAQRIFDELVRTSALNRELTRLERKSELLEKALSRRREKRQARDRKLTEALLGGIAGLSLLQLVTPQPDASWFESPWAIGLVGAILTLPLLIVVAVLRRRD